MQRHREAIPQRVARGRTAPPDAGGRFVRLLRRRQRDRAFELLAENAGRLRGYLTVRFSGQIGGRQGVEEVISAAIWKAIEHGQSYRPERGELAFWLWRIGVHLAQDEVRKATTRRRHESHAARDPRIQREREELQSAVREAIGRLRDERHRLILTTDLEYGGLAPAAHLSEKLGLAEQTILNLRNEARKLIRPLLVELVDGA